MKTDKIISTLVVLAFISILPIFPLVAHAMTPTLSVSPTGSGDNVQISVSGDPNVSVLLFAGSQFAILGNTNSSGNFSTVVSSAAVVTKGIQSNTTVYVKTNGLSGTQSNNASWPYVTSSSTTSTLTLSQNGGISTSALAVLLNIGQTTTVTASANYLYMLSNSTPATANININANTITIAANTYGSTVANICIVGSTTNCATITVTVQNSNAQQLTFSQNNFSIYSGQSVPVTVSGGTGNYVISNNSNSSAVQANINGSVVTLVANNAGGASSVTVCTTDMNYCGIINVSATTINSNAVTFSQTNPVVPLGQSTTVTIYGGTGNNFYVSSNSNPSIVQANINSNILTLIANAATGTSTLSICAYAGSCGTITANVSSVNNNGTISLSQSTISIVAGQSFNVTISGGSTPYTISSGSSNVFNGVVNGNILTVYGVNAGSATASVCSSTGCTNLYITVTSINSTTNPPAFSQNNILLNVGQQTTVSISGNGGYYVSNNPSQNIASVAINGSSAVVSATVAGTDNILICQSGGQCTTLYVTVSGTTAQLVLSQTNLNLTIGQSSTVSISGNGGYYIASNSNSGIASAAVSGSSLVVSAISVGTDSISLCQSGGQCANINVVITAASAQTNSPSSAGGYVISRYLFSGINGEDVLQLQKILHEKGFLSATPNGHYGPATVAAVKKFQKAHKLAQLGVVGPSTRDILNQILSSEQVSTSTSSQSTSSIQQQIQQLMSQISQMQGH